MSATAFLPPLSAEVDLPIARQQSITLHVPSPADDYLHPGAVGIALGGLGLFLVASWIGWAFGYTALLLAVIMVLCVMYFGPLIGVGQASAEARGEVTRRGFAQFLTGPVGTFTGHVTGFTALMQIAFMPIALGCLMCFLAALWLGVRG